LLEAEVLRVELRKQRELNQVRTGLVSMLSHEFRTPLTVVLTSSQMLQAYADRISPEKKSEYLNNIETQAGRLNGMIDDMLTINRADMGSEPFDPIRIDLNAFSRAIVDEMQQTTILHRIVFSSLTRMEGFNADDKLLRQALTNLISNAIKYSPRGGTIAFSILQVDDRVLIRVSDDGIGIPEADQTELFEMFRRASNVGTIQGTGLGLAIVKRAVERHHGTVSVESAVGKGTVFTLSFPAEGAPLYSGFH